MDVSITLIRMSLNFEMMKLTLACSLHFVLCKILYFWIKFVGQIWYFKPFSLLDTKFIPPSISNKQTNKQTLLLFLMIMEIFVWNDTYVSNFFAWTVYFKTCIDILYDNTQRNIFLIFTWTCLQMNCYSHNVFYRWVEIHTPMMIFSFANEMIFLWFVLQMNWYFDDTWFVLQINW